MAVDRRWLPSLVVVTLTAGGIIRLAGWQGVWTPVRVSGASMATALVGEHHRLFCRDCQAICRYDAADPPRDGRVICWNCGFVNDHTPDGPVFAGQRVLIDRFAYAWRKPNRWDVVAFPAPGDPSRLAVKRIVGLPGERIEFRRGDLVANGQMMRKSLAQLRSMAVPVHDQAYRPRQKENLPSRWQSESPASRWRAAETRFEFEPDGNRDGSMDWLIYQHWPGYAGTVPRAQPSPILDNDIYNQQLSRRLNDVDDVMLSCWMRTPGQRGRLAYEVAGRQGRCRVELRFDTREIAAFRDSHPLSRSSLPRYAFARGVLVEVAWCDGQLLFGIDGHELIREAIEEGGPDSVETAVGLENSAADSNASSPRIAVGAAGLAVAIDRLQVFRDIHYLPAAVPPGVSGTSEPLGPNELFVIGDNVPVSHDSRHWPQPGVPIDGLLGRVWWRNRR